MLYICLNISEQSNYSGYGSKHLDPYFDEIVRLIESRFHDIRIEKSVNEVRDYRKYDSMYEKLHRSLKNS